MRNFISPVLSCEGVAFPAIPSTDNCIQSIYLSQVSAIIMLPYGATGPENWTDYNSFSAIIDNADTTGTKGKIIFCKGEMGLPTDITATLGRKSSVYIKKRFELRADIPIISDAMNNFVQSIGGRKTGFNFWFVTLGGRLLGGNKGIRPEYVKSDVIYPGGDADVEIGKILLTWYGDNIGAVVNMAGLLDGTAPEPPAETGLSVLDQFFPDQIGNVLYWTTNGGVLPTTNTGAQILVFMEGQKLAPDQVSFNHLSAPGTSEIVINALTHWDGARYHVIVIL